MSEDIHKWTDGRYTLMFDEHTFFVWDNEKEKRMTALQVTKKLNEQQATIKELKERNAHNFAQNIQLKKEIKGLKEENEALKKFIKDNFNEMMNSKMVVE